MAGGRSLDHVEGDETTKSPSGPWQSREESVLSDHFSHGWCPGEHTVVGVKNLSFKFLFCQSLHLGFPFCQIRIRGFMENRCFCHGMVIVEVVLVVVTMLMVGGGDGNGRGAGGGSDGGVVVVDDGGGDGGVDSGVGRWEMITVFPEHMRSITLC